MSSSIVVTPQQCLSLLEVLYHLNGDRDPDTPKIALLTGLPGAGKSELLKNILSEMINTEKLKRNEITIMGKTHATVNVLRNILRERNYDNIRMGTFHKIFRYPVRARESFFNINLAANLYKWKEIKFLIIDEYNQCKSSEVLFVDCVLRLVKKNYACPFGGTKILFIGDNNQNKSFESGDICEEQEEYLQFGKEAFRDILTNLTYEYGRSRSQENYGNGTAPKCINKRHLYVENYYRNYMLEIIRGENNEFSIEECDHLYETGGPVVLANEPLIRREGDTLMEKFFKHVAKKRKPKYRKDENVEVGPVAVTNKRAATTSATATAASPPAAAIADVDAVVIGINTKFPRKEEEKEEEEYEEEEEGRGGLYDDPHEAYVDILLKTRAENNLFQNLKHIDKNLNYKMFISTRTRIVFIYSFKRFNPFMSKEGLFFGLGLTYLGRNNFADDRVCLPEWKYFSGVAFGEAISSHLVNRKIVMEELRRHKRIERILDEQFLGGRSKFKKLNMAKGYALYRKTNYGEKKVLKYLSSTNQTMYQVNTVNTSLYQNSVTEYLDKAIHNFKHFFPKIRFKTVAYDNDQHLNSIYDVRKYDFHAVLWSLKLRQNYHTVMLRRCQRPETWYNSLQRYITKEYCDFNGVTIYVGMYVRVRRNIFNGGDEVFNGTTGYVLRITETGVMIRLSETRRIVNVGYETEMDGDFKFSFLPLSSETISTIYSIQGYTIEPSVHTIIDAKDKRAFITKGSNLYVALSRIKSANFTLMDVDDEEVEDIYRLMDQHIENEHNLKMTPFYEVISQLQSQPSQHQLDQQYHWRRQQQFGTSEESKIRLFLQRKADDSLIPYYSLSLKFVIELILKFSQSEILISENWIKAVKVAENLDADSNNNNYLYENRNDIKCIISGNGDKQTNNQLRETPLYRFSAAIKNCLVDLSLFPINSDENNVLGVSMLERALLKNLQISYCVYLKNSEVPLNRFLMSSRTRGKIKKKRSFHSFAPPKITDERTGFILNWEEFKIVYAFFFTQTRMYVDAGSIINYLFHFYELENAFDTQFGYSCPRRDDGDECSAGSRKRNINRNNNNNSLYHPCCYCVDVKLKSGPVLIHCEKYDHNLRDSEDQIDAKNGAAAEVDNKKAKMDFTKFRYSPSSDKKMNLSGGNGEHDDEEEGDRNKFPPTAFEKWINGSERNRKNLNSLIFVKKRKKLDDFDLMGKEEEKIKRRSELHQENSREGVEGERESEGEMEMEMNEEGEEEQEEEEEQDEEEELSFFVEHRYQKCFKYYSQNLCYVLFYYLNQVFKIQIEIFGNREIAAVNLYKNLFHNFFLSENDCDSCVEDLSRAIKTYYPDVFLTTTPIDRDDQSIDGAGGVCGGGKSGNNFNGATSYKITLVMIEYKPFSHVTDKLLARKKYKSIRNAINDLTSFNLGYFESLRIKKPNVYPDEKALKRGVQSLLMEASKNNKKSKNDFVDHIRGEEQSPSPSTSTHQNVSSNIHFLSMYVEPFSIEKECNGQNREEEEERKQKQQHYHQHCNNFASIKETFSRIRGCDDGSDSSSSALNMSHILIKLLLQEQRNKK